MKRKLLGILFGISISLAAGVVNATLISGDFDIFAELSGEGADDGDPLSAQLGITIDSTSTTTWTLENTTVSSSGPTSGGQGTGDPPRIDELFFSLFNMSFSDLTSQILSITDGGATLDCDGPDSGDSRCDWVLTDGGSSGGGGTFNLSEFAQSNDANLGITEQLIFQLTSTGPEFGLNTFLSAPDSTNGPNTTGFQVAASFQTVGTDGQDSGVATGRYIEGGGGLQQIPEPNVLALFGTGLLGLGLIGRRRKRLA